MYPLSGKDNFLVCDFSCSVIGLRVKPSGCANIFVSEAKSSLYSRLQID